LVLQRAADIPGRPLVADTAKATTSGATVDFTGIPAWVNRITVILNGVSTNGTDNLLVQIGDAGGFETTSYTAISFYAATAGSNAVGVTSTAGFIISGVNAAAYAHNGSLTLCRVSGNTWVESGVTHSETYAAWHSGTKTLSDTLTQVRLTTTGGANTFDAGSANILYE